ncbi:non-ribosomal peptide synthetase [Catenulispora subtropica]|uniref:Carrier domain-containing protein n=1 Tax=Catenulispora subtropica TaxID=450798 RepID=A0ABP5DLB5_9ACTN
MEKVGTDVDDHEEITAALPFGQACRLAGPCGTSRRSLRMAGPAGPAPSPKDLLAAALLLGRKYADRPGFEVGVRHAAWPPGADSARFAALMPAGLTLGEHLRAVAERLPEVLPEPESSGGARPALLCVLDGPAAPEHGHDLALWLQSDSEGTLLHVDYHEHVHDAHVADRILGHLGVLLNHLAERPESTVDFINILTLAEHAALALVNETSRPYPDAQTVYELFQAQVTQGPDRTAIRHDGGDVTYAELAEQARRLAGALRTHGVRRGHRVAFLLGKTPALPAVMVAVLQLGAVYVPLDPAWPASRRSAVLLDSGAEALVTDDPGIHADVPVVLVDGLGHPEPEPPLPTDPVGGARDLAYVIYTSGTTGTPKGVQVDHGAIARLVCAADYVRLGPGTTILQTGSAAFDACTFEVWGALLNGGSLVLVPEDTLLDAARLAAAIVRHGVNTVFVTTALFNRLVEQEPAVFDGCQLLVGGEAASPRHFAAAIAACPDAEVSNIYGPTENTTFSTVHRLTWAPLGPVPIGRPIANSTAYVLDSEGNPQPIGVPGELLVGGAGLSTGYLGRPDLDEHAFVTSGPHGERLYRTGDIVRWTEEMTLEYVGRQDHQVKIRGFRVELGEVETHLRRIPALRETIAQVFRTPEGPTALCAYYTADRAVEAREIRDALQHELPEYMIPTRYLQLDAMPLTQNQKVDRAVLAGLTTTGLDDAPGRAPRTARERTAAELFAQVLGLRSVGMDDDFFSLGGHSLLAMRLWTRVREEIDPRIGLSDILARPTAAAVAELAERTFVADSAGAADRLVRPKLVRRS